MTRKYMDRISRALTHVKVKVLCGSRRKRRTIRKTIPVEVIREHINSSGQDVRVSVFFIFI